MAVNEQDFKNALKLWASGVTVVTSKTVQHGIKGMTATSFTSVSLQPPQILVCINQTADTGEVMLDGKQFAVNILNASQQDVSNQFAGGSSQAQRFASVKWHEGMLGSPVLDDALASVECRVVKQVLAGTHWVIIGKVEHVVCHAGEPLIYYNSAYREISVS